MNLRIASIGPIGVFVSIALSISPTWATVTQVDGTIIPESGIVQSELDSQGETLDAVADAAEFPEVFLPNTTGLVVFRDFAEFAGFENSIGWYNIGDDIVSSNGRAANLHPILGCGVPMLDHAFDPNNLDTGHHHGNPAMYVQDAEPTVDVSVDFAAEAVAGRYNGGFIAFYIITPEGNPSSDNCGDFIDDGGENSRIGRIYYTQKDLNDDGDFVHHLVYTSSVQSDRFYFAFEDLFRGGDNDFSDMMLRVDGLTPPCIPNAEICDGLDNDCDGLIDELDPDLLGVGDSCQCDGISLTCADGPTFGICQDGATVCNSGVIECTSTTGPSSEICDGLDNDCNNSIDDSPAGIGIACDGPDADLCPEGLTICQNGGLGCSDNTGPNEELCDGIDNDCDTLVDENPTDVGASCGSSIGSCSPGVEICSAGALDCDGETGPSAELCNGLDDNCNGVTDDSPTDIGASCGVTDVGPCDFGTTICVGGAPACAGEVGPQPETCNLVDDDCNNVVDDNPIDVGSPCGTDTGVCEPGTIECTASGPACVGGVSGGGELCNGLDDDCNGLIDDNPPGVDDACGQGEGVCEPGLTKCINGAFQCVGGFSGTTETCNGEDDNCDGMIDEGDLCGGGACINGECTSPCDGGEFSCPVGQACIDDFCVSDACFGIICPNEQDGAQNICDEGVCVAICDTVTCQEGVICRPTDGACVPNTCTFLPLCSDGELCKQDECVVDLCFEVECASDEFCRAGDCIGSCGGIDCETGQNCIDGSCQETGCAENCSGGFVCDAASGECVANPCQGVDCGRDLVCDTTNGECVDDPCLGVVCPSETECSVGNCFDIEEVGGDAGPEPQYVTPGGGGGCSTTGGQESGPWLSLVLAFALWAYRRRLYRRALHLLPSLLLGVFLVQGSACSNSGYCINCDENGNPIGGDGGVQLDASIDAGADASPACADGVIRMEVCDEIDNDCDGRIDEDFNLNSDFLNCGSCDTSCEKAGTRTECINGTCEASECFPGNVDNNGDLGDPFSNSDGCEYSCFVSNGGIEACDGLDNDCDGLIDENTDLQNDSDNCGQCGRVCSFFQASGSCTGGSCAFDPITDCTSGFLDNNGTQLDGCEYFCTPSNGGVESCDLVDNDCDGMADEDFDTSSDVLHCGQCERACQFTNAIPSCTSGVCTFDPLSDCLPGFVDANGLAVDGCEYVCTPTNGGVEICDLIDNDCNGIADGPTTDSNLACNNGPMGIATGICSNTGSTVCSLGTIVCVGAPQPDVETCNGLDDDCNGVSDESLSQQCYSGPNGTDGIGDCSPGLQMCIGGVFTGACVGETTPAVSETCDNADEDCDGQIDENASGNAITQGCYSGLAGTAGIGECVAGAQTCTFGVFGTCQGEVVDSADICGDGLDTDCDSLGDAAEGCLVVDLSDFRVDQAGPLGTAAGSNHSFDLAAAAGGQVLGERSYLAWSDLSNGNSDIYFSRSLDGGQTWSDAENLTSGIGRAAVKPLIVVAPGAVDGVHIVFQTVNGGVRDIQVRSSTDSGASFSAVTAALDGAQDSFHHAAGLSDDGLTLVLAWEELNTTTLTRDIVSRVSVDSGVTFEAQRTINVGSGASAIAGRPKVGITSSGRIVYVWREIRAGVTSDIFTAFSDSATAVILPGDELRLDGDIADEVDSGLPLLRVVGQAVYVAWPGISTVSGEGSDVLFARSLDNGATFSSELILDDPIVEVSSSFSPAIAVDAAGPGSADDRVFIAWEDRREGTQIYISMSVNGGTTFAAPTRVSNDMGAPIGGTTYDPKVVFTGGDIVVVSYANTLGGASDHIFASTSIDAGASWDFSQTQIDTGSGAALDPVLVPCSDLGLVNGACVGWNDFRAGTQINGDPYVRRLGQ